MPTEGNNPSTSAPNESDEAPWGHVYRLEFVLRNATGEDEVSRAVLAHLADLPEVSRVGLALVEGAGRRLRFLASDRVDDAGGWCHIDAYDDVPLMTVIRTGDPVWGNLDALERRYAGVVARQRQAGTCALAALPLRAGGPVLGGIVVFFDAPQRFDAAQRRLLETCARRTAEAIRQVHAAGKGPRRSLVPAARDDAKAARLELDADPRAASAARRFLRNNLEEWGVDDDASDSAQLCVSELVTNAIMHARATSELSLLLEDDVLEVVIRDHGGAAAAHLPPTPSASQDEDPLAVFGRGLTVVDAVADRWGTERDDSGTVAWFVVELAGDSSTRAC